MIITVVIKSSSLMMCLVGGFRSFTAVLVFKLLSACTHIKRMNSMTSGITHLLIRKLKPFALN